MYFIPHVRGQDEEAGLINFYRDLINFQYSSQVFHPFFFLWQDNLRLFFITCKSHQLSGDNSWKAQQHRFCAKPNLFPEGLNVFFWQISSSYCAFLQSVVLSLFLAFWQVVKHH